MVAKSSQVRTLPKLSTKGYRFAPAIKKIPLARYVLMRTTRPWEKSMVLFFLVAVFLYLVYIAVNLWG